MEGIRISLRQCGKLAHVTSACRQSCHKTISQNKRPLPIKTIHIQSLHNFHNVKYNRITVFAARPEDEAIESGDDDEDPFSDEDEELIGEDFEGVTINTNEVPEYVPFHEEYSRRRVCTQRISHSHTQHYRYIAWADYMDKDLQPAPLHEFADEQGIHIEPQVTSKNAATAPSTDEDGIEKRKPSKEKEIWKSKDPIIGNSSAARFFGGDSFPIGRSNPGDLSEWDHRASMEKKRRLKKKRDEWLDHKRRTLGRYSAVASDWRNDTRITMTGDPTQPYYREWTMKEIWDLITLNGKSVDPRNVPHKVEQPGSEVDFVAEGFVQHPSVPDWLDSQGKILREEDEDVVVDRDAEAALFNSEFSDFEDFGGLSGGDQGGESIDDGFGGSDM